VGIGIAERVADEPLRVYGVNAGPKDPMEVFAKLWERTVQ
jgi:hypothetical protein